MDRPETISLLRSAHDAIIRLRRQNVELAPRAQAYDTIAILAGLAQPKERRCAEVDVAWRIKEALDRLVDERAEERAADIAAAEAGPEN